MKIKTFEFVVNCFVGSFTHDGGGSSYVRSVETLKQKEVVSPSEVDAIVNDFCVDKKVLSIRDNFYTVHRHNNAYDDTVVRSVTVVYEDVGV